MLYNIFSNEIRNCLQCNPPPIAMKRTSNSFILRIIELNLNIYDILGHQGVTYRILKLAKQTKRAQL